MTPSADEHGLRRVGVRTVRGLDGPVGEDELVVERPLEVRLEARNADGSIERRSIVTLRTPGCDLELAAGLLFAEGVVDSPESIDWIEADESSEGDVVSVGLRGDSSRLPEARAAFISASCGACGKATLAALQSRRRHPIRSGSTRVAPSTIHRLPALLRTAQSAFERSGGVHAAGLFSTDGTLLDLREDVGRHNALDKLLGRAFLDHAMPLADRIVFVSGRTGFELVQKAAMAGVPILASVGAPTSLAVEIAHGCGMTLLGFVRDERFNVYADFGRIALPRDATSDGIRAADEEACLP